MDITCPNCKTKQELDGDDLPSHACDDGDYECIECEYVMSIGWYAVAELREKE